MKEYEGLFQNCLQVEQQGGVYHPKRFVGALSRAYQQESEIYRVREASSAGIKLAFTTAQMSLSFAFRLILPVRNFFVMDVYENGVLLDVYHGTQFDQFQTWQFNKKIVGESTIEIHLPVYGSIFIKEMNFGDFQAMDCSKKKNYLALGDSITQGVQSLHPSRALASALACAWDANLLNHGVGGYYFNAERLETIAEFDPDIITVAYGTNDSARCQDAQQAKKSIEDYFDKLASIYQQKQVYVISPIYRGDVRPAGKNILLAQIREMIEAKAKACGFHFVDGLKMVPNTAEYFCADFVHPNDDGFQAFLENFKQECAVCENDRERL